MKAIKVENLSKAYQLGEIGTGTLSNDLKRWAYKVRGKEDPFLKIGETNDRTTKGESDMVWSLKDLNFEIEKGDAVGIIGRNGAGKSTLLKILSRVTSPTTGSVKVKGRVASLLEVGTGFHPELTGRENIFLNGAILGMRKAEIKKHFDAIVDFAGVERYIDTPVKRYSSGMYVRLAFAVAAHLESEILIVDEVLAVGDAEFQKKCLGKMKDVSKGEGRTVLFVSHNMHSITSLSNNGILLEYGKLKIAGDINNVITEYLKSRENKETARALQKSNTDLGGFLKITLTDEFGNNSNDFPVGRKWIVEIEYELNYFLKDVIVGLSLFNQFDVQTRTTWTQAENLNKGTYVVKFIEDKILWSPGTYKIHIGLTTGLKNIHYVSDANEFTINDISDFTDSKRVINLNYGIINNPMTYENNIKADFL